MATPSPDVATTCVPDIPGLVATLGFLADVVRLGAMRGGLEPGIGSSASGVNVPLPNEPSLPPFARNFATPKETRRLASSFPASSCSLFSEDRNPLAILLILVQYIRSRPLHIELIRKHLANRQKDRQN